MIVQSEELSKLSFSCERDSIRFLCTMAEADILLKKGTGIDSEFVSEKSARTGAGERTTLHAMNFSSVLQSRTIILVVERALLRYISIPKKYGLSGIVGLSVALYLNDTRRV